MKNLYSYLTLALVSVMSLASCSRSEYAFKPSAGSYHSASSSVTTKTIPSETTAPVTEAMPAQEAAPLVVAKPTRQVAVRAPKTAAPAAPVAALRSVVKTSVVEKVLASKLLKKAAKHTNTASANQQQSKAGRAGIVVGIGLLLLLLGGAAEISIVALIGLIAFIVGLVMLIAALING